MRVTVRLFAALRDAAGWEAQSLDLPDSATVGDARLKVRDELRSAGALLDISAFAVNQQYARPEHRLREGDELAVLPPVSGG